MNGLATHRQPATDGRDKVVPSVFVFVVEQTTMRDQRGLRDRAEVSAR